MYEMTPVRLSWRRTYVNFTDAMVESMSSLRHIDKIVAPVTVAYGSLETPDFQRQNREFAAALRKAGKLVDLIEGKNYTHSLMSESVGHPYGPAGRAALAMMKLAPA
jgi:arylformamidase